MAAARRWSGDEPAKDDGSETYASDWEMETGDEEMFRARPRQRQRGGFFATLSTLLRRQASRSRPLPSTLDASGRERADEDMPARWQHPAKSRSKFWVRWLLWRTPITILCCFGVLHLILAGLARKSVFYDRPDYAPDWGAPGHPGEGLAHYPGDATRDVLPIPCHSHNDYWRRIPLFDAISHGCIGVEADVWERKGEDGLLVGHSASSLTANRTFRSLYVDPLVTMLDEMNAQTSKDAPRHGVFDEDPTQTLVLLVDFKTNGEKLFPRVLEQLEPLRGRDYLSYWDGEAFQSRAVTVVGTGNAPFDLIVADATRRDIFFDAPIDAFYDGGSSAAILHPRGQGGTGTAHTTPDSFNASNSYYASTSFDASIGLPYGELSARQLDLLRGQIKGAHDRGLKARFWETPAWPTSLRNHVWQVLVDEGADMLNVDDLQAAATFDWKRHVPHGWVDA